MNIKPVRLLDANGACIRRIKEPESLVLKIWKRPFIKRSTGYGK